MKNIKYIVFVAAILAVIVIVVTQFDGYSDFSYSKLKVKIVTNKHTKDDFIITLKPLIYPNYSCETMGENQGNNNYPIVSILDTLGFNIERIDTPFAANGITIKSGTFWRRIKGVFESATGNKVPEKMIEDLDSFLSLAELPKELTFEIEKSDSLREVLLLNWFRNLNSDKELFIYSSSKDDKVSLPEEFKVIPVFNSYDELSKVLKERFCNNTELDFVIIHEPFVGKGNTSKSDVVDPPVGDPPAVVVDPPVLVVDPPVVDPPAVVVDPPAVVVDPPAVVVEPPAVVVEPPAVVVEPPAVVVEPPAVVVEPPVVVVDPPVVVVDPPVINLEVTSQKIFEMQEKHISTLLDKIAGLTMTVDQEAAFNDSRVYFENLKKSANNREKFIEYENMQLDLAALKSDINKNK